jgi:hypothetical protein
MSLDSPWGLRSLSPAMSLIRNDWQKASETHERALIVDATRSPEGLDVERLRWTGAGEWATGDGAGHFVSVIRGSARLRIGGETLALASDVHVFLPLSAGAVFECDAGTEIVHVASTNVRGEKFLVRDEAFLRACADGQHSLRWILTPQYLSRRVFLHHDKTLLSKSGDPVSWFHTTMFDTAGLHPNQDGESVFKMSYNSRTEFNVCYDVKGDARVRRAVHPYTAEKQVWEPWLAIDGDTTYHLDEARGGPAEERVAEGTLRNRHEVYAFGGHVTLLCLFDPAPTGVERHRPGEYSDYEPITNIPAELLRQHRDASLRFDEMVDGLSLAKARGAAAPAALVALSGEGLVAQRTIESDLCAVLRREGIGRERVLSPWLVGET